jgi:hypothetical protein
MNVIYTHKETAEEGVEKGGIPGCLMIAAEQVVFSPQG